MDALNHIREAVFNYAAVLMALLLAQVSSLTAVGALILLILKIVMEIPRAMIVLRSIRRKRDE